MNDNDYDGYDEMALASLPRTSKNFINEREVIQLCGKAKLSLDELYDLFPHEFIFYIEGYLENEREYFEFMNYSLFSSIRQALGNKKKFDNPFEKDKAEPEQRKLSDEEYEAEVEALKEIFNF